MKYSATRPIKAMVEVVTIVYKKLQEKPNSDDFINEFYQTFN